MANTAGQTLLRGINLDKKARNYENEESIFYNEILKTKTSNREIRYYQRTSGYLTATSPADIIVSEGTTPFCLETSWTRNTVYTKKYMLDTPMINDEDEKDSEVRVFIENMQEVIAAIVNKRDGDIWDVATESQSPTNINSVTTVAPWDSASGQDPMKDISEALRKIRQQTKRKLRNPKLYLNAKSEEDLKVWLTTKVGTYFTEVASDVIKEGVVSRFAGCKIVVSENVTSDYALVGDMKEAVEYFELTPIGTAIIKEERVGKKVRVSTNGTAALVKPKYLALVSNMVS